MGTPTDPTGQPSSAKNAVPVPPSGEPEPNPVPPNERNGSTHSHQPNNTLSDLVRSGSSLRPRSTESEIAQFLAFPQGAANTDDAPTIITLNAKKAIGPSQPVPLAVASDPLSVAGRRLGHFELIEAIGAGGMAAVLKARDLELGRIVALKILPPEAARDPESVTRFKQEGRAAAKLDHENVARVYYCGEDQGLHFIAFEFVEGDNLRVIIDRRGPLPANECVRYMMQVAAGLNHAAERGVVHRDIKPSNILITPDGRAKIVDMGLARYLGSELVNGTVTQSGVTLGTFDYISPEQALDPRRADVRSDIYSLGCTFYHALTGRPPVPEGTAARKLRAHQEDDFLDPRELNHAIPDELAAILARMMMKNQNDRYQTPTELIAHLKGLAERLNVADALAHDTAAQAVPAEQRLLPESPKFRPWWVMAAVAVALAAVAFVVSTGAPGPAVGLPGTGDPLKDKDTSKSELKGPNPVVNPNAGAAVVNTVDELVKRLEDPTTTKVVLAARTFDLTKLPQGVAFQGAKLELVGAAAGGTRVIVTARAQRGSAGSLTVKADTTVVVRGVWFALQEDADTEAAFSDQPIGLRIEDATSVDLTDCVFMPSEVLRANHEPRAVSVTRATEGVATASVTVTRCLFAPGAVALALPAGTTATITDCGFAPHTIAAIQFDTAASESLPRSEIRFDRSSFMLDPGGAAVETGTPVSLSVKASDCLFAPVHGKSAGASAPGPGVVVRVRGENFDGVQFSGTGGRTNAFYSVNPVGTPAGSLTFEECKTAAGLSVEVQGRVELKQRPWYELEPGATVASTSPWKAFRLQVKTDPVLFTSNKGERPEPLGVAFHNKADTSSFGRHRAYPDLRLWPPDRPVNAADVKEKIWFPDAPATAELPPGTFPELRALLKVARPDDVILIKHNGELQVDGEELKSQTKPSDGDIRVTFKPAAGFKPVLVIQGDVGNDQTLFKLMTGEVTFVGVHFHLKPNRPKDGQSVSAVSVLGGKSCTFKNCVFTLAEEDDSKAAAVRLPDAEKVMKMDAATRQPPKVVFDHCVIRGKGRGVWVEVTRPVNLEMTDTLTAIDGPVLLAESGGKPGAGGMSNAKFLRVTALAGGPIVEMRGGKATDAMRASGLVKLEVEADECLFVAVPGAGRPLVELEGVEPTDWKSLLGWQVKKANRYANFDTSAEAVVALIRPVDGTAKEWGWDDWVNNVGEPASATGKRLGKVTFASFPAGLKELSAVKPADLAVKTVDFPDLMGAKLTDAGAGPKLLLVLPDEPKPE